MKLRCLPLLGVALLAIVTDSADAHGGQYAGPPDIVPPPVPGGPTGGGPRGPNTPVTGQPSGPTAPQPSGPVPGGPTTPGGSPTPGARSGGRATGAPTDLVDLTTWDMWWELNHHGYVRLKDAVHTGAVVTGEEGFFHGHHRFRAADSLRPTRDQIQTSVLPALRRAIDSTEQRDIASSCMVAMAKIGENHPEFRLVDVFKARLQREDQEIRETAALAIGIAGRYENGEVDLLSGLALDDATGRAAYGGKVDNRTRSFALHGLGLLVKEHRKLELEQRVLSISKQLLANHNAFDRNVKVAAIHALGQLGVGGTDSGERGLRQDAISVLANYLDKDLGAGEELIQSHCPTAIQKLVGKSGPLADAWKAKFAAMLQPKNGRRDGADLARSCVLALGQMCGAHDDASSPDAKFSRLLLATYTDHRDAQTRYFAVLALGQIGGKANRAVLLEKLPSANKALERPWCALALGVLADASYRTARAQGLEAVPDREIGMELARHLKHAKGDSLISALGIAIGLAGHQEAAPELAEIALADLQKTQRAGYLALGLGLLRDRSAIAPLRQLLDESSRRPDLLRQAATALGMVGDKGIAELLQKRLEAEGSNLVNFAGLSAALGQIGDRRSIQPLVQMLFDESRAPLNRAFAAVALGGIGDRAPLPWHTAIGANLNYRASVETLINSQSGILDIL